MAEQVVNTVSGQLNGALDDSQVDVTLVSASGFPADGDFRLKVDNELMLVTGVAGVVLTVTRGIESTVAVAHNDGRAAKVVHTAAGLATYMSEQASGAELAYAEGTTPLTITSTTEASSDAVISAPSFEADGVTPVLIEFHAPYWRPNTTAGDAIYLTLWDGSTELGRIGLKYTATTGQNGYTPCHGTFRYTPAAGTRTVHAKSHVSTGSGTVGAGAGGVATYAPLHIRITKV
jgi:hypothetical protein